MRNMMIMFLLLAGQIVALAQNQDFERKYNLLVGQGGLAGVGVETILDRWEESDPDNVKMLAARFNYLLTKSQSTEVVSRSEPKYLGMDPVLSLRDSIYVYQVPVYDDTLYGEAISAVDKAISVHPRRLEFRFLKANALMSYEKESPDMALSNLLALAREFADGEGTWTYDGEEAGPEFFQQAMQEYCVTFYTMSTPATLEAFSRLSQTMSSLYPKNHEFIRNIGTYNLTVRRDYKAALKYYGKVLKICPDDYAALKNSVIAARYMGNKKLIMKDQTRLNAVQTK